MSKSTLKQLWDKKAPWYIKVLRTGTISAALVFAHPYALEALPGEPLPDDQMASLQDFYGDNLDISAIRVHSSKFGDIYLTALGATAATYGHTVLVRSEVIGNPFFSYVMAHETGHTLQQEKGKSAAYMEGLTQKLGVIFSSRTVPDLYDYSLLEHESLSEYGIEQQASILADYYNIKNGANPYHLTDKLTGEQRDARYIHVLGDFLPRSVPAAEAPAIPAV